MNKLAVIGQSYRYSAPVLLVVIERLYRRIRWYAAQKQGH